MPRLRVHRAPLNCLGCVIAPEDSNNAAPLLNVKTHRWWPGTSAATPKPGTAYDIPLPHSINDYLYIASQLPLRATRDSPKSKRRRRGHRLARPVRSGKEAEKSASAVGATRLPPATLCLSLNMRGSTSYPSQ